MMAFKLVSSDQFIDSCCIMMTQKPLQAAICKGFCCVRLYQIGSLKLMQLTVLLSIYQLKRMDIWTHGKKTNRYKD